MSFFFKNQKEDLIQKAAWRLVRAAEDRLPDVPGAQRREWCVDRLMVQFPKEKVRDHIEDYVRAAYVNFRIETGDYQRRVSRI